MEKQDASMRAFKGFGRCDSFNGRRGGGGLEVWRNREFEDVDK